MNSKGLRIPRHYTTVGGDPFDHFVFVLKSASIKNPDGSIVFEMRDLEMPSHWDQTAVDVLASKYLRKAGVPVVDADGLPVIGPDGAVVLGAETSVKQWARRLAGAWRYWGERGNYFATDEDAAAFEDEMIYTLVAQMGSPNSPQHFNTGLFESYGIMADPEGNWYYDEATGEVVQSTHRYERAAVNACFIQSINDELVGPGSIFDLIHAEARLFKAGSGTGTNFSALRGKGEPLSGGGTSSGMMSFLRVSDRAAGAIRSGGTTRRAAKMVILDANHPEIEDFIWSKVIEEEKAAALIAAGFDSDWRAENGAYDTVSFQNGNHSVRLPAGFLDAVENDEVWDLTARVDGSVIKQVRARDLWEMIASAAWRSADPGVQFDDILNDWNTAANDARLNGTNPCFPGSARVHTDRGLISFGELVERVGAGESFEVWTHDETSADNPQSTVTLSTPEAFLITGVNDIVALTFSNGAVLRCTPGHRIFTTNRGFVEAQELRDDDRVKVADLAVPPVSAEYDIWLSKDAKVAAGEQIASRYLAKTVTTSLPEKWTPELGHLLGWLTGDGSITIASTGGNTSVTWIYGSEPDKTDIMGAHHAIINEITGADYPAVDMANGTTQLRINRRPFLDFLFGMGFSTANSHAKRVPESIFHAPADILASYLQGLFDANGTVISSKNGTRYVGLDSSSKALLEDVQKLLAAFGITGRIYETREAGEDALCYTTVAGDDRSYASKPMYSLRLAGQSIPRFAAHIGFKRSDKRQRVEAMLDSVRGFYNTDSTVSLVSRVDDGREVTYNLSEPKNHSYIVDGIVVRNCSEYTHIDDTACNLASINLVEFFDDETGEFRFDDYLHASRLWTIVLEISVSMSHYPSAKIATNSYEHRTLGLGYANVGALLMRAGLAYDSDQGRAAMAALTALMHDQAYVTSAEMARAVGPCVAYERNVEHVERIIRNHARAALGTLPAGAALGDFEELHVMPQAIDHDMLSTTLFAGATNYIEKVAAEMVTSSEFGRRNMQVTVLAPTGTISLIMDCDTTGVEPDFALIKFKKLAGGGYMKIVNGSVEPALWRLGYDEDAARGIVEYAVGTNTLHGATPINAASLTGCGLDSDTITRIESELPQSLVLEQVFSPYTLGEAVMSGLGLDPNAPILPQLGFSGDEIQQSSLAICGHQTVEGAPGLAPEHLAVFDTANYCGDGTRVIAWEGHVRALGAVAPHLSGSASKTVNLPNSATVEEIQSCYELGYKLGVKCVAVYRDGSKLSQVLSSQTDGGEDDPDLVLDAEETIQEHIDAMRLALLEPPLGTSPTQHYADSSPVRFRLPGQINGPRWKFALGGIEVFLHAGEYPDGTLGEIWIDIAKEGSTLKGILSCFAIAVSTGMQYGVPLGKLVDMFVGHAFEPRGPVSGNENLKMANSIVDAIFRLLGYHYLGRDELVQVPTTRDTGVRVGGIVIEPVKPAPSTAPVAPAPVGKSENATVTSVPLSSAFTGESCPACHGMRMVKSGTCSRCLDCGETTGCS